MKRISLYIFAVLLLIGCNPNNVSEPSKMDIVVDTIRATQIQITFSAENEDAYYLLGVVYADDIKQFGTIDNLIQENLDYLSSLFERENSADDIYSSFEEMYLYRGSKKMGFYYLPPETNFIVFSVQVNPSTRKIIGEVETKEVRTPSLVKSDNMFNVWAIEDTIFIYPSNDDPYWWDYISKTDIDSIFNGNPATYVYETVDMYEEYGFMENDLSVGPTKWVISEDDPSIEEGEEYFFYIMGYNGEINTEVSEYSFTYSDKEIIDFSRMDNNVNLPGASNIIRPYCRPPRTEE